MTIVVGPGTEVIAGEGTIVTAGGFDTHIHFICPQQIEEALMSGVTSMLGAHRSGAWHVRHDLHAGAVPSRPHDPGGGCVSNESRLRGQRKTLRVRRRWKKWSRPAPVR